MAQESVERVTKTWRMLLLQRAGNMADVCRLFHARVPLTAMRPTVVGWGEWVDERLMVETLWTKW